MDEVTAGHPASSPPSSPVTPRWFWWGLVAACVVGIGARLAFAVIYAPDLPLPGDAQVYREMAGHLVAGEGLALGRPGDGVVEPSAEHPPLFPTLLASLDVVGLGSVQEQRVALAVLSGAGIVAVGLLGRRLSGPAAGVVGASVAAVHPLWLQPAGIVMSESLHLVLVPVVLLASLAVLERSTPLRAVGLGALVGAVALGRPESLGLIPLVALPAVVAGCDGARRRALLSALVVLGALALVVPWVVRNVDAVGGAVLATNPGKTILGSNCDDTYGGPALGGFSYDCFFGTATVLVQYGTPDGGRWSGRTLDEEMGRLGREYISEHRGEVPRVVVARLARMWGVAFAEDQLDFDVYEGRHRRLQQLGQWFHLSLLPFTAFGVLALSRRAPWRLVVMVGPIVLVSAATLLVYGGTRMRAGAEASIVVLAAVGLVWLAEGVHARRTTQGHGGQDGNVGPA